MRVPIYLFIIFFAISCSPATQDEAGSATETSSAGQAFIKDDQSAENILQVAAGSEDHTTLVAAVQAAELENVLANNGPFTVFAPTNEAFAALPEGTLDELLKPENKDQLTKIIWHHAVPGIYKDDLLKDGSSLYLATGHYAKVVRSGDDVTVDGARILGSVSASNGVIHVVDKVLLPPGE